MRKIGNLLNKDLKNSFIMKIPYYWKTKKERKKLFLYPFLALMFGIYLYLGIEYVIDWIEGYDKFGLGHVYLGQAVFAYSGLLLLSVVTMIIGNFYYSNDISIMLSLPIKKSEIIVSKIIYNSLSLFVTALFIVFPFMIRYGIFYAKSIVFYILFVLGLFAHTLILVSIFTFLVVAIMSVINRYARVKNILQVLSTIVIIGLSFGFSYMVNSQPERGQVSFDFLQIIATKFDNIIGKIPTINLLVSGVNGNALNYIILLVLAIGLVYLVSQFSGGLLTKGIMSNQSVVKRRKLSLKERSQVFKQESSFVQIVKKDLTEILKTPIYFTSTLLLGILMPLIIAIPILAKGGDEALTFIKQASQLFEVFESSISKKEMIAFSIFGLIIIMLFVSSSASSTAGTSITREGRYLWIIQTIPVDARTQVSARIFSALTIHLISLIPISLISFILLKPPYYLLLVYAIVLIVTGFFAASLGILLDILRPKKDWQTPQQAMKSNMNVVILSYSSMILAVLVGLGFYGLLSSGTGEKDLFLASILLLLGLALIAFILYHFAIKTFEKKLSTY
ncbi:MAG: hypothetical protein Q4E50_05220 [Tissierellia bacterium]|nr:hypothetical protein [Tissierellia bacterium]